MALSSVELVMARRQVNAMIKADPEKVQFIRTPWEKQADNSYTKGDPVTLEPQEVCFLPFKRRLVEATENTEYGEIPNQPWVILGRHDLDVERGDKVTWQGTEYEVIELDVKVEQHKVVHVSAHREVETNG